MAMSWFWLLSLGLSIFSALLSGRGAALGNALIRGAQAGVSLSISLAGGLCLWSGAGRLLEAGGITDGLSRLLAPVLGRLFPGTRQDRELARDVSGNVCANLLGLGNAATPMGIRAAQRMARTGAATPELCRLVVLNTASIQLIPTTVAALRASLGCEQPFDLLLPVWLTSLCSAAAGLIAARILERFCRL